MGTMGAWLVRWLGVCILTVAIVGMWHVPIVGGKALLITGFALLGISTLVAAVIPFGKLLGVLLSGFLASLALWSEPNPDFGRIGALGEVVALLIATSGGEMLSWGRGGEVSGWYYLMFYWKAARKPCGLPQG